MLLFSRILKIKKIERTNFEIFLWWELRRLIFIFFITIFIILGSKIIGMNILKIEMGTGEYFLFIGMILVTIILNVLYSFGWIIELFKRERSLTYAPNTFKIFVLLSLVAFSLLFGLTYFILNN